MKPHMNRNLKIWLMLATLVAMTLLAVFWTTTRVPIPSPWIPRVPWRQPPIREDIEFYYTVKTVISTINVTLLIFLLVTYIDIYRKTQSEFTIGLIIFSLVLLFYALASNPWVHWVFGFSAVGLGPFAMLPDLFTCAALAVLLYFTVRY